MNKKDIVDNVTKNIKLSMEDKEIIEAINIARLEWESAGNFFQMVMEPELIDYAIYMENAACVRYMHLLKIAKAKNITSNYYNSMRELDIR